MATSELSEVSEIAPGAAKTAFRVFGSTRNADCKRFVIASLSRHCFPVQFPREQWRTRPKSHLLRFELENVLPIDAEDMDVYCQPYQQGWLAIAVDRNHYQQEIDERRQNGGWLAGVCPVALLASVQIEDFIDKTGRVLIAWRSGQEFDLLTFDRGNLTDWLWNTGGDASAGSMVLNAVYRHEVQKVLLVNFDESVDLGTLECNSDASFENQKSVDIEYREVDLLEAAQQTVDQCLEDTLVPRYLFDCQSQTAADHIAPYARPLLIFGAALPMMLIIVSICMQLWRMERQSVIDENTRAQEEIFQELFKNQRIPVGIRTRLESESRQLAATRGLTEKSHRSDSVLAVVHAFLSATPADSSTRFRWDRLEFSSGKLGLGIGMTTSFQEYEAIASSLKQAGFAIPPLSLSQSGEGVSMRIENATHTPYLPVVSVQKNSGTAKDGSKTPPAVPSIDTKSTPSQGASDGVH